jgi:hypothetical protein
MLITLYHTAPRRKAQEAHADQPVQRDADLAEERAPDARRSSVRRLRLAGGLAVNLERAG